MFGRRRKAGSGPLVHVAVVGAQGHGKSTLVQALTEALPHEFEQAEQPPGQFASGRGAYQLHDSPGLDDFRSRLAVGAGQLGGLVLAVSSVQGPTAETREYLQVARAAGVPWVVIFYGHRDLVGKEVAEEIRELEVLELLQETGYCVDHSEIGNIFFVHGSAVPAVNNPGDKRSRRDVVELASNMDRRFR